MAIGQKTAFMWRFLEPKRAVSRSPLGYDTTKEEIYIMGKKLYSFFLAEYGCPAMACDQGLLAIEVDGLDIWDPCKIHVHWGCLTDRQWPWQGRVRVRLQVKNEQPILQDLARFSLCRSYSCAQDLQRSRKMSGKNGCIIIWQDLSRSLVIF
jgi:hypothetical protein